MQATRKARPRRRAPFTAARRAAVVQAALHFVVERYRLDAAAAERLAAIPVRWRAGAGRSAFYPRPARGYGVPHIQIRVPRGAAARWHTYRRVRARLSTPAGGIELPVELLVTVVLVHEYTHAVQHGVCGGSKRRYSEVETTENEIEFVRRHAPAAFEQLVHVQRGVVRRVRRRGHVKGAGPDGGTRRAPRNPALAALRMLRDIIQRYRSGRAE